MLSRLSIATRQADLAFLVGELDRLNDTRPAGGVWARGAQKGGQESGVAGWELRVHHYRTEKEGWKCGHN
jgi:hypothetical protein